MGVSIIKSNADFGGVALFVTDEDPRYTNKVTSKPIEDGADISDHINQEPVTINVSFNVPANGKEAKRQLLKLRNSKKVYTYNGVDETYKNMALVSLSTPKNANIKDGFEGSMQLQQVQVINQETSEVILGSDPATGQQVQKNNKDTPKKEPDNTEMVDGSGIYYSARTVVEDEA